VTGPHQADALRPATRGGRGRAASKRGAKAAAGAKKMHSSFDISAGAEEAGETLPVLHPPSGPARGG
jgi:hypothetical protein